MHTFVGIFGVVYMVIFQ